MCILMFHITCTKGKIIEKHAHFPKGKQHYGISVKKIFFLCAYAIQVYRQQQQLRKCWWNE